MRISYGSLSLQIWIQIVWPVKVLGHHLTQLQQSALYQLINHICQHQNKSNCNKYVGLVPRMAPSFDFRFEIFRAALIKGSGSTVVSFS